MNVIKKVKRGKKREMMKEKKNENIDGNILNIVKIVDIEKENLDIEGMIIVEEKNGKNKKRIEGEGRKDKEKEI